MSPKKRSYEEAIANASSSTQAVRSFFSERRGACPDNGQVSSSSASVHSGPFSEAKRSTSRSSVNGAGSDAESSSVSTSSEESSFESGLDDESDDEDNSEDESERIITVASSKEKRKPSIEASRLKKDINSLNSRLRDFIPQLVAANNELDREKLAGKIEQRNMELIDETSGEQFIEMNLGLGVLEHTRPGHSENHDYANKPSSDDDSHDSELDKGSDKELEKDVMGRLMGTRRTKSHIGIQEVGND